MGWPASGFGMLRWFATTGFMPNNSLWLTYSFIQAPPRYRIFYFSHAFAHGYSAGYYSYIWSEVLDADTVEWIKEHGGLKRENGDRFREMLLSRGGSADALGLFKNFVGRDPYIEPLLKRRGLDRAPGSDGAKVESQSPGH